MKNLYRSKTVKEAKKFLSSEGGKGDHGFTGKQLKAWEKMRDGWREALTAIVKDQPIPRKYWNFEPECPRDAVPRYVPANQRDISLVNAPPGHAWHDGCAYATGVKMKSNPKWSPGTKAGQLWAASVHEVILEALDDANERETIEEGIQEAKNRLASLVRDVAKFVKS